MKKLLTLTLLLGAMIFALPGTEAKAATNAAPQDRWERNNRNDQNRRWNQRNVRIVNRTRIVRIGRQRFRETIQIRYLPNGRTQTRIINRVRIR